MVYVEDFSGQGAESWAQSTYRTSDLGNHDALLVVATVDRSYWFLVPGSVNNVSSDEVTNLRRNEIEPALSRGDWSGTAVAAANGLNKASAATKVPWSAVFAIIGVIVLALAALLVLMRWRRRRRRAAEFAAARRVDLTDPNALASVSLDALDDLSREKVVDVDNAVRTSSNELELAVEEFGSDRTEPFTRAVGNAKATLAQAFTIRQQLDDAIPETAAQRRNLLTRVVVSAALADRELDAQKAAFEQLRDLVINAAAKLDTMTQQLVELTARIAPSEQKMAVLRSEFDSAALASVSGNVTIAQERLKFADQNITRARELVTRPVAGQQAELVDTVRAAESALGQARSLLDAVDSAESDINRAAAMLPSAIADIQNGIAQADAQLRQGNGPHVSELTAARGAAASAVETAQTTGSTDPLGAFTGLTKADAELDRLLARSPKNARPPNGWLAHTIKRCSARSLGCARCPTTLTPAAAASVRRPEPGSPKRSGNFRRRRPPERATSTRRSPTPTGRRCLPPRRNHWPTPTCRTPNACTPGGTAVGIRTWARCSAGSSSATF